MAASARPNPYVNVISYLKKRAEMTTDFDDVKVQSALLKIIPPAIDFSGVKAAEIDGFDCTVPNKMFRNWIDLIPENDRGFIRFVYADGADANVEKYLAAAMTSPAFLKFRPLASAPANDDDLFLMRHLIWYSVVLRRPVGFDFGVYEMNAIFGALPVDISKNKTKFGRKISFVDFYRMIWFAKWGLSAVDSGGKNAD